MNVDLTSLPFENSLVLASALVATMIGLLVTLRRGHWLTTLLFSAAFLVMAAFQAGTLGILHADSPDSARRWAIYLGRTSALASWLWLALSVVLARKDPWEQIRNALAYLTLALVGSIAMSFMAGSAYVVTEVVGLGSPGIIAFGPLGKIYLLYLVVALVAVLMNLERMVRNAQASAQKRLRPIFIALSFAIFTELLMISGGLLYGGLRVSWLVATASPLFVSGVATALALARRRLSDLTIPVARPVVYYSSVSLTLAAAFMLTMGVLSKVLPTLSPEGKRTVSLAFYALAGGGGLILVLSPAANRAVKRFIDRNFYANRYDYRREWERVSGALAPAARIEDICKQVEALVRSVFDAERVVVYVAREAGGPLLRMLGPAAMPYEIAPENELVVHLGRTREPLQFREAALDLDQVPAAAENRDAIEALDAQVVAPLMAGDAVVGMLWLSGKRSEEEYTSEDVEFLAAMARQVAAALWFARIAEQLVETRQLESLNRLSSFVLHDIKNQVSGLSLVVENAHRHLSNPDFQRDAMVVVERTVRNLRELMEQVAGVARSPDVNAEPCDLKALFEEAALASGLVAGERDGIRLVLDCNVPDPVLADRRLLSRVLINLLTNAREALGSGGVIEMSAAAERVGAGRRLTITVKDTGRGMSEEFLRTALFKPFATTKPAGLGVGLAQCKSIVEAHSGTISAVSRAGQGTTFRVNMPLDGPPSAVPVMRSEASRVAAASPGAASIPREVGL